MFSIIAIRLFGLLWLTALVIVFFVLNFFFIEACGTPSPCGPWDGLMPLVNPFRLEFWTTWTLLAIAAVPGVGALRRAARLRRQSEASALAGENPSAPKPKAGLRHPGWLTHLALYVAAVVPMYLAATAEVAAPLPAREERHFHVAAIRANEKHAVPMILAHLKEARPAPGALSFLLPEGEIKVNAQGHDLHAAKVLERHSDRQLIEYRYGNTRDSISRYWAYKDRVEPVSFRITMDPGILISAIVLLVPVSLLSALINWLWAYALRKKAAAAA